MTPRRRERRPLSPSSMRRAAPFPGSGSSVATWSSSTRGRGLWTRHRLLDHEARDGLAGLVSIVGVKYTTARGVAEQALDLVLRRSGHTGPACRTATTTLTGAAPLSGSLVEQTRRAVHDEMAVSLSDAVLRRLDLGTAAPPDEEKLGVVAKTMGSELGWSSERLHLERQTLAEAYAMAVRLRSG